MIRGKTISYASYKKKERDKREIDLLNTLKNLYENSLTDEIEKAIEEKENELKQIREKKIQGILLRAKSRWKVEGEKSTRYFCNLEKRHFTEKTISKLITEDGTIKTEIKDILTEQKSFYEKLYTSELTNNDETLYRNMFFDNNNPFIEKLSFEEKELLEGPITETELLKCLKSLKNLKSPGLDGFTPEFYKFFWSDLKIPLLNSLNHAYEIGELSLSKKQGVITCLPKEGKQKEFIKNWRPISLLNIDYKLASSCISNRFQSIMHKLISNTQSGFMKGRDISDCTRFVNDLLYETKKNEK